jgi:hypothetical protein
MMMVAEENLKFEALHVRCCSDLVKECIPYTMFHTYTSGGGGLFADSPGFSQGSLAKVMRATLRELFPEVRARQEASASTGRCSFANCLHIGEPCFAIGSDWEHDCLWSRESHKKGESQGTSKGRLLDFLHNSRAHSFLLPLLVFL